MARGGEGSAPEGCGRRDATIISAFRTRKIAARQRRRNPGRRAARRWHETKCTPSEAALIPGRRLMVGSLTCLEPISNDLVLALHFFEFFSGLFVPGDGSLEMALALQRAVFAMRHRSSPTGGNACVNRHFKTWKQTRIIGGDFPRPFGAVCEELSWFRPMNVPATGTRVRARFSRELSLFDARSFPHAAQCGAGAASIGETAFLSARSMMSAGLTVSHFTDAEWGR